MNEETRRVGHSAAPVAPHAPFALDVEGVPQRPPALGVASLVGGLLLGPVLGNALASWLAPGSPRGSGRRLRGVPAGLRAGHGLLARAPLVAAVPVFAAAGLAYGLALRALARHGYVPFPEPA